MKRGFTLLFLLAFVAPWVGGTPTARAATTWQVLAGTESPDMAIQALAYLPRDITISVGDSVTWTYDAMEFHTVSFLSGGTFPPFIIPDGKGGALVNPLSALPQGGSVYDGTGFVSSGLGAPLGEDPRGKTYTLTFSRPGTFNYICLVHPTMTGSVSVRSSGSPSTDQAAVSALGSAQASALLSKGKQLIESQRVTANSGPNGTTVYTIAAGAGDGTVSIQRFLPVGLEIRVGDTVVWEDRDPVSPHTVTFNPELLGPPPPPPPAGTPIEAILALPPFFLNPSGGSSFNGHGFVNSAMFGDPGDPQAPKSYRLTFTAPGTFPYICLLHSDQKMVGSITVLPASAPAPSIYSGLDIATLVDRLLRGGR